MKKDELLEKSLAVGFIGLIIVAVGLMLLTLGITIFMDLFLFVAGVFIIVMLGGVVYSLWVEK